MKVTVNNKEVETQANNLFQLAEELHLPLKGIAVAVNREMIPRAEWPEFALETGQDIIIIKAVCGG